MNNEILQTAVELDNKLNQLRIELTAIRDELTDVDRAIITLENLDKTQNSNTILYIDRLLMIETSNIKIKNIYVSVDSFHKLKMSIPEAKDYLNKRRQELKTNYEKLEKELKEIQNRIVQLLKQMNK